MAKRILCLKGSPRKEGNTNRLAKYTVDAAKQAGAKVSEIEVDLIRHKYPGCTACMACQKSDEYRCVIKDELTKFVAEVVDYDVILLATPVYWMSYPAPLKIFIDRMFCLGKFSADGLETTLKGKLFALLGTAGGELEDNLSLLEAQWKHAAEFIGNDFKSALFPMVPEDPQQIDSNKEFVKKASQFGTQLAQ